MITGGNVADCTAGAKLIDRLPKCAVVNADKGYDSDALRARTRDRGALANIPPKANRKEKPCFSPFLYRDRNAIERMFCRLKDMECELLDRHRFASHTQARMLVFQFIEGFYDPTRRHSALCYLSPIEYERWHDDLTKPT